MSNPLQNILEKLPLGPDFIRRAQRFVMGIAQDFWKDGHGSMLADLKHLSHRLHATAALEDSEHQTTRAPTVSTGPWHAAPGEIAERMWGKGFMHPGDNKIGEMLNTQLNLTKDMGVLDLSAGLGGRMRQITKQFGTAVTGLEADASVAARGSALAPIAAYDLNNLTTDKTYDAALARELFYRVEDKEKFLQSLSACLKPTAQISFTDYVVNPEDRNKPAIVAWQKFEKGAAPLGLIEMAEAWAKIGFNLRIHDDQTEFYTAEVTQGLKRFAQFMTTGARPDAETKTNLLHNLQIWTYRMAAIRQGMKFYRFYGSRP